MVVFQSIQPARMEKSPSQIFKSIESRVEDRRCYLQTKLCRRSQLPRGLERRSLLGLRGAGGRVGEVRWVFPVIWVGDMVNDTISML
jgi:hypothetical protein